MLLDDLCDHNMVCRYKTFIIKLYRFWITLSDPDFKFSKWVPYDILPKKNQKTFYWDTVSHSSKLAVVSLLPATIVIGKISIVDTRSSYFFVSLNASHKSVTLSLMCQLSLSPLFLFYFLKHRLVRPKVIQVMPAQSGTWATEKKATQPRFFFYANICFINQYPYVH